MYSQEIENPIVGCLETEWMLHSFINENDN